MSLRSVRYSKKYSRVVIYTEGCVFNCKGCSYKAKINRNRIKKRNITIDKIKKILKIFDPKYLHFVGGEPLHTPEVYDIANFSRRLGIKNVIGHSTGWYLPSNDFDKINITIKSYSSEIHKEYTGYSNKRILRNFKKCYELGLKIKASTVFIPSFIDEEEIKKIAKFISKIDSSIPLHITGYIPMPGTPWRAPTQKEMENIVKITKKYLKNVTYSLYKNVEEYSKMIRENPQYQSVEILA